MSFSRGDKSAIALHVVTGRACFSAKMLMQALSTPRFILGPCVHLTNFLGGCRKLQIVLIVLVVFAAAFGVYWVWAKGKIRPLLDFLEALPECLRRIWRRTGLGRRYAAVDDEGIELI